MAIDIQIKAVGLSPKITKRQIQKLKSATLRITAARWHDRYSQFKFTPAAARKYNYRERKTKYIRTGKVKRSKGGRPLAPNGNPLVWTGETRRLARFRKVTGNSKRSHVTSPISTLNRKPPGNRLLNMRKEYTTVLPSEERQLGKDAEKFLRSQFRGGKKNIKVVT